MARYMSKAYADREQDIERWEHDLATAATTRNSDRKDQLHRQIAEAKQVIADSGYDRGTTGDCENEKRPAATD
jgi:hypothetical protein